VGTGKHPACTRVGYFSSFFLGGSRVRGPVHVVGHGVEDGPDVSSTERLVDGLDRLDVVLRTHRIPFPGGGVLVGFFAAQAPQRAGIGSDRPPRTSSSTKLTM